MWCTSTYNFYSRAAYQVLPLSLIHTWLGGCGSEGRVVASNNREVRIQSSANRWFVWDSNPGHRMPEKMFVSQFSKILNLTLWGKLYITYLYTVNCIETKKYKEKETGNGPIKKRFCKLHSGTSKITLKSPTYQYTHCRGSITVHGWSPVRLHWIQPKLENLL